MCTFIYMCNIIINNLVHNNVISHKLVGVNYMYIYVPHLIGHCGIHGLYIVYMKKCQPITLST